LNEYGGSMRNFQIASFSLLLVLATGCIGEAPLPEDLEEYVGESQAALRGSNIDNSYWAAMGRDPEPFEVSYWNGLRDFSASDVMRWHGDWLASNSGSRDRYETINRSYLTVFGRGAWSYETEYWEQEVIDKHRLFQDIVYWLREYAKNKGMHVTGTWCSPVFDGSAFRSQCGPRYVIDPATEQ
jgi:hypothetical protein